MARLLRYVELKSGYQDDGPAWIALVQASRSGRTIYFDGRALKRSARCVRGNHFDLTTGEEFWVSGVKRDGRDRHACGAGKVRIEAAAVEAYLAATGAAALDESRLVIVAALRPTDPADFVALENRARGEGGPRTPLSDDEVGSP